MKIALITAVWKRPKLTEIVLDYYSRWFADRLPGVEFERVAAISGADPDWTPNKVVGCGWTPVPARNSPLSQKIQTALTFLRTDFSDFDPDAVMVVDTDCLVGPGWIPWVRNQDADLCYLNGGAFLCAQPGHSRFGQAVHVRSFQFGPGMIFDWSIIEREGGVLWPCDEDRNINSMAVEAAQPADTERLNETGFYEATPLEIKVGQGLHDFDNVLQRAGSARTVPYNWKSLGPDLWGRRTCQQLANYLTDIESDG